MLCGVIVKNQHFGFSLVEVLIALFLGSLLITGIVGSAVDVMNNMNIGRMLSQRMNAERFLSHIVTTNIQSAGLTTCSGSTNNNAAVVVLAGGSKWPKWITGKKTNTDGLLLQGCRWYKGKFSLVTWSLYVAKTSYKDKNDHFVYGLYEKVKGSRRQELVPYVTNLSLSLGFLNEDGVVSFAKDVSNLSSSEQPNAHKAKLVKSIFTLDFVEHNHLVDTVEYDVSLRS